MKRTLGIAASVTGLLVVGAILFVLWATSGPISPDGLSETKQYTAGTASPEQDTFQVMTYNLGHLSRGDGHASDSAVAENLTGAADLLRRADPDVVGLQDVDFGAARTGFVHQLDSIATRLNFPVAVQDVSWNDRYVPFSGGGSVRSGALVSGQAILSRFPVRRSVRRELTSSQFASWRPFRRSPLIQITAVDIGGWPLVVMNVHFTGSDVDLREKQARNVNALYGRLAQQGFPVLLVGTLGSPVPGQRAAGSGEARAANRDETIRIVRDGTNLRPAFSSEAALVTGQSVGTYPAERPVKKLDFILYQPRLIVPTDTKIWCGDSVSRPSDHCALTMSFLLPRPKDALPDEQIPDTRLPSLDRLLRDGGTERRGKHSR